MNLNRAFILGNLTRDPEKRSLPSGQPVTSFGVATNRFFNNKDGERQQEVEFHNVTTFGRLADIASRYLKKGSLVFIEGRLRTNNWQDKQGVKHFRTEIIANNLQLGPRSMSQSSERNNSSQFQTKKEDIPVVKEKKPKGKKKDDEEIDVKDIPF